MKVKTRIVVHKEGFIRERESFAAEVLCVKFIVERACKIVLGRSGMDRIELLKCWHEENMMRMK